MSGHVSVVSWILLLTIFVGYSSAAGVPTLGGRPARKDEKAYFLAAVASGREKLTSGECFVAGRMSLRGWSGPAEVKIHLLFDMTRGLLRYDEQVPGTVADKPTIPQPVKVILVKRPDLNLEWTSSPFGGQDLNYYAPGPIGPGSPQWPIDIRSVGLEGITAWVRGYNTLGKVLAFLEEGTLAAVDELDGGDIARTDWLFRKGPNNPTKQLDVIYRIWFDTRLQYVPIKVETYFCTTNDRGEVRELEPEPVTITEVGWRDEKGVAIPISINGSEGATTRDIYQLAIDWRDVNGDIDEKSFAKESLGLPGQTQIVDHRLGSPLYLGRLDGLTLKRRTSIFPTAPSTRVYWVLANCFLIVVLLFVLWRRRRIQQSSF